jgi:hypothetical protein
VRLSALGHRYSSKSASGESASGEETWSLWPPIVLVPQSGTQLVARPFPLPGDGWSQLPTTETVSLQFVEHARVFGWIGVILSEFGINANAGYVATVTLPPRQIASPSPAH